MRLDVLYNLPYGNSGISIDIPPGYGVKVIKPVSVPAVNDEIGLIRMALEHPINCRRLHEIAKKGKKAVIIVSDTTRPTPTARLLPPLVSELKSGGILDITVIFGLGIHRKQTEEEKKKILGEFYGKIKRIVSHVDDFLFFIATNRP